MGNVSDVDPARMRRDAEHQIPLSSAQERLWFLDRLDVGSAYNMPLVLRLEGDLNVTALERSFGELIRRHEILRTRFHAIHGVPYQRIDETGSFELHRADLSQVADPSEHERQLRECMLREQMHRFDLTEGPLLRVVLLTLRERSYALLVTMHHIVSDGWSHGVLSDEISALYRAFLLEQPSPLRELPTQYADYAISQREQLHDEHLQEQLRYWRERLLGAPPYLELPTDRPRPATSSHHGAWLSRELPESTLTALKTLARRQGATLFMLSLAAYQVLLSRWSGERDLVVGTPIAGRNRSELEGLIGLFLNTLALRVQISGDMTFLQLLKSVKEVALDAYAHQDLPFEVLVKELRPERDLTRQPIFQVSLVLQNYRQLQLNLPGITCTRVDGERVMSHFDLTLLLREDDVSHGLSMTFEYATDLFERATIERLAESFRTLLEGIVENPDCPVDRLPLLSEAEKNELLFDWNATSAAFPDEKLVHELFEEQAQRTPHEVAAVHQGRSLTYAELDARANHLAQRLRDNGLGPDKVAGLCIERSLEMVIGVLAILKAGGAYLPLDPTYPVERLRYMLEDAAPVVVLTQNSLRVALPSTRAEVIALDGYADEAAPRSASSVRSAALGLHSGHLAYVIYTSGSTGQPKGVMVEHGNVVNLWCGLEQIYRQSLPCRRIALNASINFDASVQQLIQLLSGRTVFIVPSGIRQDASALTKFVTENRIEAIDCTPSQLKMWISAGLFARRDSHLRVVLVGGEAIDPELWSVLAESSETDFYNVYGPTECTVDAMAAHVTHHAKGPHIGRPMANRRVYVLDDRCRPVPIGAPGEIYIGGAGVGRGYLNRPELTAERFVVDPFNVESRARMYRTSDLGRWRSDGTLEYLGRNDDQVKIRGHRIELGEIEAHLARHGKVSEAAVVVREDAPGDKRLIAYITQRDQVAPTSDELRAHLKNTLPEHMVPSAFVVLERLPLTRSGKLDRRALPAPDSSAWSSRAYEPPRGEVEQELARIWQELLQVDRIGRRDNFFDLGAHSLLVMRVIVRIQESFSVEMSVRSLFACPTLEKLAVELNDRRRRQLLDNIESGGGELEELLEQVASMPDSEVQELLSQLRTEDDRS